MTAQNYSQPMNTNPTIENQGAAVSVGSDRLLGGLRFNDGTLTIGCDRKTGWQFQLYVPKLRIERAYLGNDYAKTCVTGFNLQARTALRVVYHGRAGEIAIGAELLGFGFAAQYVGDDCA